MAADVVSLAQNPDGSMQAPDNPDTVGWFAPGPSIGQPGNAILDGHVDWAGRLRVFGRLSTLHPGDEIDVTNTEGETLSYAVEWTRQYPVDAFPSEVWAQPADAEEITLITCGGVFDPATRSYLARIVVRAQRV